MRATQRRTHRGGILTNGPDEWTTRLKHGGRVQRLAAPQKWPDRPTDPNGGVGFFWRLFVCLLAFFSGSVTVRAPEAVSPRWKHGVTPGCQAEDHAVNQ
ncbi:hypothetical protein AALO_G00204380 [Alosa alosa]|uniref:Uncharacterized protein n=1 Tax=Alosa alosa TaxID=278164 RepID=A0AAV6G4V1_9TELE|nr:hypothetical protein AALO_G00204380 [Alosa alosa]